VTVSVDSTGTIEAITVPFGIDVTGLRVAYFATSEGKVVSAAHRVNPLL
jgi:hypothetical protein